MSGNRWTEIFNTSKITARGPFRHDERVLYFDLTSPRQLSFRLVGCYHQKNSKAKSMCVSSAIPSGGPQAFTMPKSELPCSPWLARSDVIHRQRSSYNLRRQQRKHIAYESTSDRITYRAVQGMPPWRGHGAASATLPPQAPAAAPSSSAVSLPAMNSPLHSPSSAGDGVASSAARSAPDESNEPDVESEHDDASDGSDTVSIHSANLE